MYRNEFRPKQSIVLHVIVLTLTLLAVVILLVNANYPVKAQSHSSEIESVADVVPETDGTGNCRYGVAQLGGDADSPYINEMDAGWKVDFTGYFSRANKDTAAFSPTVRFKPVADGDSDPTNNGYRIIGPQLNDQPGQIGDLAVKHPGRIWLIGNEVDRDFFQDELYPQTYARAYHDVYHFIKSRDPSARIAISGLVLVSPNRLQYLDIVYNTYKQTYGSTIPVDIWNAHLYILPERNWGTYDDPSSGGIALGTNPATAIFSSGGNSLNCSREDVYCYAEHDDINIVKQQLKMMREWMHGKGEGNKPLIISEFGVLFPYDQEGDSDPNTCYLKDEYGKCFPPERVSQFMVQSFNLFETYTDPYLGYKIDDYRMVQKWLWYPTVNQGVQENKALIKWDRSSLTLVGETFRDAVRPKYISVVLDDAPTLAYNANGAVVDAEITVRLRNKGNLKEPSGFQVLFYRDSGLTDLIGSVAMPSGLEGCSVEEYKASIIWSGLTSGMHPYWVTTSRGSLAKGEVWVDPPFQVFVPVIFR